jgi:hypothetical protein
MTAKHSTGRSRARMKMTICNLDVIELTLRRRQDAILPID